MKFLIMLLLGYFAYRVILQPMLQAPPPPNDNKADDAEYTEYEEIE